MSRLELVAYRWYLASLAYRRRVLIFRPRRGAVAPGRLMSRENPRVGCEMAGSATLADNGFGTYA